MKRLIINTVTSLLIFSMFGSCKKTLDNNFLSPNNPTNESIGNLFTGMLMNNRIHQSYWDYYTMIETVYAPFSQICAVAPGDNMYIPNSSYISSRWEDYYAGSIGAGATSVDYRFSGPGILNNYTEMKTTYAALAPEQQASQYVFLQAGKVILCDQTAQMIDLWGDIPFFEANSLNSTRSLSLAPFDDAATVYDTLIANLKDLNTYFDTVTLSSNTQSAFTSQDMIYGGDLSQWRRYANSLRLRLLMRISNVNESVAKNEVSIMLGDPNTYPMIDDNQYNAQFNQSPSTPNMISDIQGALGLSPFAPAYMLDSLMLPNNDPRLPVYWGKDSSGGYAGMPITATTTDYTNAILSHSVSTFDSATFLYNYNVPGVLFNAAETDFLKAEADVRWGLGNASAAYYAGIEQSIAFYYNINATRILKAGSWAILPQPTAEQISAYEAEPAIAFNSAGSTTQQLAQIYTQKWLHFFILQSQQAWAEYRRTGYPQLQFFNNVSSEGEYPPTRLLYPAEEQQYNSDNYSKVVSQDTRTTKIFWDVN